MGKERWFIGRVVTDEGFRIYEISEDGLEDILDDPIGWGNIEHFMTEKEYEQALDKYDDNTWPDGLAVIIRGSIKAPRPVTKKWKLD